MTDPGPDTVDQLILSHLDEADLPEPAKELVLAALLGEEDLAAAVGGTPTRRPLPRPPEADDPEPVGTYLTGIEVTGFRGIGPTATLSLVPGPGLTIVTGRNGSGKSSFAEAAEFALTATNKRWAGRGSIWQEGWRNLHHTGEPSIRVRLGVEGHPRGATVECHWAADGRLDDCTRFLQLAGKPRQSVSELGWDKPLELYRPFLSYAELGGLLSGKPSEMYDSLQRILGLGRLVEIEKLLKDARKATQDRRYLAAQQLPALRELLAAHPDPRARRAEQALAGRRADLEQLELLAVADDAADDADVTSLRQLDVLQLPDRTQLVADIERLRDALHRIESLAATPASEARALAGLLRDALRHYDTHPGQPCPVCAGRPLDDAWAEHARTELRRLTERAEQLDEAHRTKQETLRVLRQRIPTLPPVLKLDLDAVPTADLRITWQHWDNLIASEDPHKICEVVLGTFDTLRSALHPVQAAARRALEQRQQAWQPVADQIRAWVETERASRRAAQVLPDIRKAIEWLRAVGERIRNEKLAPLTTQTTEIWNTLRHESNVSLGEIRLAGTGTTRRVDLNVEVDGVPGAALGVMSQGELHSLALALFLPRATVSESPFRFLVIDDPVQSMDPIKVYGLARVLADVARHRQVIVFTHDDRLPAAVRHLQLAARILVVSRLANSRVTVAGDRHGDPAARYLDDAAAVARDEQLAPAVRGPIVGNLIRDALEFTCHELIRTRDLQAGKAVAETEAAIDDANGLRPTLALALLGDPRRLGDLTRALNRVHPDANRVVTVANNLSHGDQASADLIALIDDARRVVERLSRR
ncbi:MAG TPA: AAA family ATPase [Micromonosporaceae bacterium]